jgi:Arc/MetJ family transcription regulator
MLRFPNPGSNISNFVAVYVAAFEQYEGQEINLDDSVQATVAANLATSSGHMGVEAISRSTRKDRSRDPLYNQLKMYAELFRSLGWLRSTETSANNCTFTLLGEQIVAARRQWLPLVGESVLGIAYPSHVIHKLGDHDIRPFATILRTMLSCNDALSRDEMIVGPLSVVSDRSDKDLANLVAQITALREEPRAIKEALEALRDKLGIQINTLKNYTRWPLAVMRDLGWTEKSGESYRRIKKTFEVHRLTPLGKERAQGLDHSIDLRADQVGELPFEQKRALSRHAHFEMMDRAGFDISTVADQLRADEKMLQETLRVLDLPGGRPLLFSPFQALSIADSSAIFPTQTAAPAGGAVQAVLDGTNVGRGSRDHLFVEPAFVESTAEAEGSELDTLKEELEGLWEAHPTLEEAAQAFAESRINDTQTLFYPLVTHLIRLLGFESDYSRAGVNYQRWDAFVTLNELAVPIEIKSPTEEMFLSTKAIRQAVENKVILLSRGGLETNADLTSLIVGYKIPNERGDMSTLIDDIYATFGFNIGVLDLRTLGLLAIRAVTESVSVDEGQLSHLKGFLNV